VRTSLIKKRSTTPARLKLLRFKKERGKFFGTYLNTKAAMEALVQLVTVRNLPYNCNTWSELHALLTAANYTTEEPINTSHGHVQKLCSDSYAIHKNILRKKLQFSPAKLDLSAAVWNAPNHKAFLGMCVHFMQEGMKNPFQALLVLPELLGTDGPTQELSPEMHCVSWFQPIAI
jgi:hypothetical protein